MKRNTVAIVQARMGSSRLPGKVLLPLAGHAVLYHIWERLSQVHALDTIVVATTSDESDAPLIKYCREKGIDIFPYTGSADDLLSRYLSCGEAYNADVIVMVDGDCPLLHPPTVERMVAALTGKPEAEYARLDGQSIEGGVAVLRLSTFEKIASLVSDSAHREHATLFLMENPHLFSIVDVPCEDDFRGIKHRLWLDTPADYRFLQEVYGRLYRPGHVVDLHEVVHLIRHDEAVRSLNSHVKQKHVRPRERKVCVVPQGLADGDLEFAGKLLALLIERFHIGVRVQDDNLSMGQKAFWRSQMIHLGAGAARSGEAVVTLTSGVEGLQPQIPGRHGEPHIVATLREQTDVAGLAELLACYLGLKAGALGHFDAAQAASGGRPDFETVACPLCGSGHREIIWHHKSGVSNAMCLDCGHVYLADRPVAELIEASYAVFRQNYPDSYLMDDASAIHQLARLRHEEVKAFCAGPRHVLEIGCGYGHFLGQFDAAVLKVGVEPSHDQAAFARAHFGIAEVWECGIERFNELPPSWPKEGFDLVCSFHVLEHLPDPGLFLRFAKRCLRPGGLLVLAVPNLLTLSPDLTELFFLCRGLHLHTFSPGVLRGLLEREGMDVLSAKDERPLPMLRSSMMVVARSSSEVPKNPKATATAIAEVSSSIRAFHEELDRRLGAAKKIFSKWKTEERKVAIYGGGVHTRALLELADLGASSIRLIIDDDPDKQGTTMHRIPIADLSNALAQGAEVIVVSSLASEDALLERLSKEVGQRVEVVGIYRDMVAQERK